VLKGAAGVLGAFKSLVMARVPKVVHALLCISENSIGEVHVDNTHLLLQAFYFNRAARNPK
jgi:hypothetical protein